MQSESQTSLAPGQLALNQLGSREKQKLEQFFNQKLVSKFAIKESMAMLELLFQDFKLHPILKKRIIESFLYASETVSNFLVDNYC